jgi:hypothetical protein
MCLVGRLASFRSFGYCNLDTSKATVLWWLILYSKSRNMHLLTNLQWWKHLATFCWMSNYWGRFTYCTDIFKVMVSHERIKHSTTQLSFKLGGDGQWRNAIMFIKESLHQIKTSLMTYYVSWSWMFFNN